MAATGTAQQASPANTGRAWEQVTKEQIERSAEHSVESRIFLLEQALLRRATVLDHYEARMREMLVASVR